MHTVSTNTTITSQVLEIISEPERASSVFFKQKGQFILAKMHLNEPQYSETMLFANNMNVCVNGSINWGSLDLMNCHTSTEHLLKTTSEDSGTAVQRTAEGSAVHYLNIKDPG